jgi:hypothetical protein
MKKSIASVPLTLSLTIQPDVMLTVRPIVTREFGQVTR